MIQPPSAIDRAEGVRRKTLAALTTMAEAAAAMALPDPPAGMAEVRRKLEENTYQVLVVGEAKRGKSSFVNALIGHNILPTDVDVATSQVFRICPAEREAYRLRFEDDSQRPIIAADLARYGSQVVADQCGVPRLDETIRWIEIDMPVKFLPPNVRILDTPGLGALYAAHAQITHRFVPHADAVIFVLESQAPIGEPEIRFVDELLGVTPNLFFVQTKIDQFGREAWQEVQRRNHDILQKRFAGRLGDCRVWPISSTNLAKVAATNDLDYLQVSRYKELEAALQNFLFRVAGWDRAAIAGGLAYDYRAQAQATLQRRLASLAPDPASRPDRAAWAARRRQFADDWSESGDNYQKLRGLIRGAANQGKRAFSQILQPTGSLEVEQQARIDQLQSAEEAKDYAARLGDQIVVAVAQRWRNATEEFRKTCAAALAPFWQASQLLDEVAQASDPSLAVAPIHGPDLGGSLYHRTASAVRASAWAPGAAVGVAHMLATPLLPVAVIAIVGIVGVGFIAAFQGWRAAAVKELKSAQSDLHKRLASMLAQIRVQFLDGGQVDDYFKTSVRQLDHQISEMVLGTLAEMDAEAARFEENAKLDDSRRAAQAEETQRQLRQWDILAEQLQEIQAELQILYRDE